MTLVGIYKLNIYSGAQGNIWNTIFFDNKKEALARYIFEVHERLGTCVGARYWLYNTQTNETLVGRQV